MNRCSCGTPVVALLGTLVLGLCVLQSLSCSSIWPSNYNLEAGYSPASRRGLFLNLQYPIPIDGTAMAWHYCYYPPTNIDRRSRIVQFATFRVWSGIFTNYYQTNHSVTQVIKTSQEISGANGFTCEVVTLSESERFKVHEGDIIGMCNGVSDVSEDDDTGQLAMEALNTVAEDSHIGGRALEYLRSSCKYFDGYIVFGILSDPVDDHMMHVSLEIAIDSDESTCLQTTHPSIYPSLTTYTPPSSFTSSSITLRPENEPADPTHSATPCFYHSLTSPSSTLSITTPVTVSERQTSKSPTLNPTTQAAGDSESDSVQGFELEAIAGVSVGSAVVVVLAAFVLLLVLIHVRRRRKRSIQIRSNQHRHIGMDHFIIVQPNIDDGYGEPVPLPYETPVSSPRPNTAIPLSQGNGNTEYSHYEFDPNYQGQVQTQTPATSEYHRLNTATAPQKVRFIRCNKPLDLIQSASTQPANSNRYSMLCKHYYKVLEQAIQTDQNKIPDEEDPYMEPALTEEDLYQQLEKHSLRSIPAHDIKITARLGSGQFGSVRKGVWKQKELNLTHEVALKSLGASQARLDQNRVKFLQEAAMMAQFSHPNVISLLGVVISDDLVILVMEFASLGDLENHLLSLNPLLSGKALPADTSSGLMCYSQQTAFGMHYLSNKGFIHRDLAARNILLAHGEICKIADFGMSRDLAKEDYYLSQGGMFPVKWTAPEAINYRRFSAASDVWSYGCLLYEIWSLGKAPFLELSNAEAFEEVESGFRLPPPPGCPRAIYKLMINCWNPTAKSRPTFRDLMIDLMEPEETILRLPEGVSMEARKLGGPLKASEELYLDLQGVYRPHPQ